MSVPTHPTYVQQSEYADPLVRSASPASSVGTQYSRDQTSYSDTEQQISDAALDRKYREKNGLENQRWEEITAEKDPLLTFPSGVPGGKPVRIADRKLNPEQENAEFQRIMHHLRNEVAQLREDEIFEQMLLRGSQAMLQPLPTSNDIDVIMRSMMGPALTISGPHKDTDVGTTSPRPPPPPMTNGPWNHYGRPLVQEPKETFPEANAAESIMSGRTAGKRSRNGTRRKL